MAHSCPQRCSQLKYWLLGTFLVCLTHAPGEALGWPCPVPAMLRHIRGAARSPPSPERVRVGAAPPAPLLPPQHAAGVSKRLVQPGFGRFDPISKPPTSGLSCPAVGGTACPLNDRGINSSQPHLETKQFFREKPQPTTYPLLSIFNSKHGCCWAGNAALVKAVEFYQSIPFASRGFVHL